MPDIFVEEASGEKSKHKMSPAPEKKSLFKDLEDPVRLLNLEKDKSKRHNHVLAAYCEMPNEVSYSNRIKDEEVYLFLRKHFITNLPWIAKASLFVIFPFIIAAFLNLFNISLFSFLPYNYMFLGLVFYFFVIFGYVFVNYITWFYNISLVTNQRIVDIDFSHIVFENVSASKLGQVEDVHYAQVGVFASIFDYGDVTVQTAGTKLVGFDFQAAPHPEKVVHFINSLIGSGRLKNG